MGTKMTMLELKTAIAITKELLEPQPALVLRSLLHPCPEAGGKVLMLSTRTWRACAVLTTSLVLLASIPDRFLMKRLQGLLSPACGAPKRCSLAQAARLVGRKLACAIADAVAIPVVVFGGRQIEV